MVANGVQIIWIRMVWAATSRHRVSLMQTSVYHIYIRFGLHASYSLFLPRSRLTVAQVYCKNRIPDSWAARCAGTSPHSWCHWVCALLSQLPQASRRYVRTDSLVFLGDRVSLGNVPWSMLIRNSLVSTSLFNTSRSRTPPF